VEKKLSIFAFQAEFFAVLGLVLLMTLLWALPVEAAVNTRCARLAPTGGGEVIVNECDRCRIVKITRKRPGNSVPVSRTFNVPAKSTFPVPFRGPGRSRVTSVQACEGDPGGAIELVNPKAKKKAETCINLKRNLRGAIVLANSCSACKAAMIERQDRSGTNGKRQVYKIKGLAAIEVPQLGAAKVGLVGTIDCPK